jgi:hypothetical protein
MSRRKDDDFDRKKPDRSRSRRRSTSRDKKGKNLLKTGNKKWTEASRFSVASSDYGDKNSNYPTKPTAMYGSNTAVNPNILYTLNDNTKIKRKIFIPKVSGVNFVGLLIGPRGTYQKRLEQQSGCKILIRGKYA